MSVTIRLARIGKRNAPAYKIVVANTRDKRNGRYLDILGYYNPSVTPVQFNFDENKYQEWRGKGAMVTDAVVKLRDGTYEYVKYEGSKVKEEKKDEGETEGEVVEEEKTVEKEEPKDEEKPVEKPAEELKEEK